MAFRFLIIGIFFGLLFGLLGFNLYRLQVEKGFYYFERAQARSEALAQLELRRGQIFFTDRYEKDIPLALNRDYPVIYAVPKEIEDSQGTAEKLSSIFNLEADALGAAFKNQKSLFKLVAEKVSGDDIKAVTDLKIKGVYVDQKQYRFYPFGKLASAVLGFVGINEKYPEPTGLYGAEKFYNDTLVQGKDVRLTIDRNLQAQAEQTLHGLIEKFEATGGVVLIEEPLSGKILALAGEPDFDPNQYAAFPIKNFLNPAIQYMYEPGSVFKPFTMAAGIDSGVLTPETTYVDTGAVTLSGKTIRNWDNKVYGKITMTRVIEQSVNTGAVFALQTVGQERFYRYLKGFGFGDKTEIDLPDEIAGSLKNLEKKDTRAIDFATASFGQGTGVTPLQLINAFSALANGGLLMRPYLYKDSKPYVVRRVVSEETAEKVTEMMESGVSRVGIAAIPDYRVAGKTGTALIPDFEKGGYTEELIHTFVGFAPVSAPRFTILIKIDKPKAGGVASLTVVPAFRELAQFLINYYNIPPDKLGDVSRPAAE